MNQDVLSELQSKTGEIDFFATEVILIFWKMITVNTGEFDNYV